MGWLEERGVDWRQSQLLGLSWDNYETTPLEQVRYDFGFAVPDSIEAEGEIGIHELPAVRSVDVHCRGDLSLIARAWDYLYDEWVSTVALRARRHARHQAVSHPARRARLEGVGSRLLHRDPAAPPLKREV